MKRIYYLSLIHLLSECASLQADNVPAASDFMVSTDEANVSNGEAVKNDRYEKNTNDFPGEDTQTPLSGFSCGWNVTYGLASGPHLQVRSSDGSIESHPYRTDVYLPLKSLVHLPTLDDNPKQTVHNTYNNRKTIGTAQSAPCRFVSGLYARYSLPAAAHGAALVEV